MLAKIHSFILLGIDAQPCEIEVDVANRGLQKTTIVGLAQTAVKESIERVKRAVINSGFAFPNHALLINLAPADVKKEGPALDLPMAIGVLRGTNFIPNDRHKQFLIAGELALDGRVRKIKGTLSLALLARNRKLRGVIVPQENAREAAVVDGIEVYPVATISQAVAFLNEQLDLEPYELDGEAYESSKLAPDLDFADVRGQEAVKRAITIACAGSHNLLMIGPPGTGKSMLAAPHSRDSAAAVTGRVAGDDADLFGAGVAAGWRGADGFAAGAHAAPFGYAQALIGGGSIPRPGEVSLAHHGILFLDELPEFSRHVLETLRQPLESGEVTVARVFGSIRFPARFMLVAAMNPTASGHKPTDPRARNKYLEKLSGPLLDRIDIHIEVPGVPYRELTGKHAGTSSEKMREQVMRTGGSRTSDSGGRRPTPAWTASSSSNSAICRTRACC